MAMGLYKNLVTHLVMLEGEGLIETQDVAIAVVKAQEAATKKGKQLQELDKNEALVGRAKAALEETSLSLINVSDQLTPEKVRKVPKESFLKESEERKGKVLPKDKDGKKNEEVVLLEVENEAGREMLRRGDEKKKKSRRSGSVEEEWMVRINNRMEENEKKKEEVIFEDKVGMEKGEENSFSSSFLSLSSSSSNDSMPVLSDQSKEGPCLLLSSPPVLDVKTFTMIDIQLLMNASHDDVLLIFFQVMEDTPSVSRRSALRLLTLVQEEEEEEERRMRNEKEEKRDKRRKRQGQGDDGEWSPKLRGSQKKSTIRSH